MSATCSEEQSTIGVCETPNVYFHYGLYLTFDGIEDWPRRAAEDLVNAKIDLPRFVAEFRERTAGLPPENVTDVEVKVGDKTQKFTFEEFAEKIKEAS